MIRPGEIGISAIIVLRNWITYVLRDCIYHQAYYNQNELDIKRKCNVRVVRETLQSFLRYLYLNRVDTFRRRYALNGVFVKWEGEYCQVAKSFDV